VRVRLVLAVLSFSAGAHAASGEGIALFPSTGNRAGAEVESAAFRFDGLHRGSYESLVLRGEYATERLTLRARVPYDTLSLRDAPTTYEGFGDTELRLRVHLRSEEPLRFSVGLVTTLPTGARHAGLGNGSAQISPFVNAGLRFDRLIVYAAVADALSLVRYPSRYPNYVDPSADHEVHVTAGSIYEFADTVGVGVVLTDTIILTTAKRGYEVVDASFQLGTQPYRRLRLVVTPSLPIAGEPRFSWKLNAAATVAF
jgi:hypothetical protein